MAISSSNLKYYLSGGASNSDPNASIGGARSSTLVTSGTLNNLFDDVSSAEASAGAVEYRCIYFRNEDSDAAGLITPVVYIISNTPSPSTTIDIGVVGTKNSSAQLLADAYTTPTGISFSSPATLGDGLPLPDAPLDQNDYVAIWVRRTTSAGAASSASDPCTIRVQGETL